MVYLVGYCIKEQLYNGSKTLVYRAVREHDQKPVIIKLLKNPYPSFSELVQFRNQYTIAKHLNSSGIIQTYSLEPYKNGYGLVMEDMGGIPLQEYFAQYNNVASLQEFLQIAISLCDILNILYRHRIIHKDIKPANILIHPKTKQVKLIDFSIASLLPRETQVLMSPNLLEGTLGYISPEQTGRMNRGIDYRTDFYSLGVTFYELLTGELPFKSEDAIELVHSHIAKQPSFRNSEEIPQVLSDIIMKLMAKNAEDRYQSTLGLKHDLATCLKQLKETGKIEYWNIAQRDICDRFIIPEKLYGREAEVEELLAAFARVAGTDTNPRSQALPSNTPSLSRSFPEPDNEGKVELMLVAGFSGIGKTAVVNEIHKPIVKQRGYFIKGKFDQFNRNIPLSAFVQAFRDLMKQLLSESDAQLSSWKNKILQALGENGQVVIEVIPELEQIIGKQPPAPELSGTAAQNRFNLLFQKFIQVFTTKEHPLVIFLDDLQWADVASLKLTQLLASESQTGYLFIIGAYRDNEVFPAHPLMITLDDLREDGAVINTITLQPLSQNSLNQLVADTLSYNVDLAQPLTQLIYQKTQGNPFFSTQFLKALYEDGLINFDLNAGYWQCNITKVKETALTDDVVEFMALQLQKLPEKTQNILKLAACIGNQFNLETLAIVSQQSEMETTTTLWRALREGFILPQSEVYKFYIGQEHQVDREEVSQAVNYKFLHDRVQQAAYSLIPEDHKQITHLQIGQLLLHNTSKTEREERIFEIVNQLNIGVDLITDLEQRNELAQLNLIAGRKARIANAYAASFEYLMLGIKLLAPDSWLQSYDLTLALYESAAEAAYLSNNFEVMEGLIEVVLQQTPTLLDRVKVYDVKIQGYGAQNELRQAVDTALIILKALGVTLPETPSQFDIQQALAQTKGFWTGKDPLDLIALPEMEMAEFQAAMQILSSIIPIAYQVSPELFVLSVLKQVDLSVQYGNTDLSAHAYACYGCILCSMTGEIESGFQFGQLSLALLEKFKSKELKGKSLYVVSAIVTHWQELISLTLKPLLDAYNYALESGDLSHAAWAIYMYGYHSYFMGKELSELEQEMAAHSEQLGQIRQESVIQVHNICRQAVLNLMGMNDNPLELSGSAYDEQIMLPLCQEASNQTIICKYYIQKLILCYLLGDQLTALKTADLTEPYLSAVVGYLDVPLFHFYDSLVRLAAFPKIDESAQEAILSRVIANQEKMEKWAHHAPMNYLHKFELVEAERHRVLGNKAKALDYYDSAIAGAKVNGYIQEEALANELVAKLYLEWGKEKAAQCYMQEAYYCYARWGAKAKTSDLEKRYPQLLTPILQWQRDPFGLSESGVQTIDKQRFINQTIQRSISSSSGIAIAKVIDLASIFKASQALSSEIQLEQLISKLMQVVMENAGAKKAALVLLKDDTLMLEAVATTNQDVMLLGLPCSESLDIPNTVVNYVKRSLETVVLDHATAQNDFIADPYLMQQQPLSLLCTPILNQGNLIGLLYLENNLTIGAFTQDRVDILNLLCTQAAISLENAQLYRKLKDYSYTLEQKVSERTLELTQKATQLESTLEKLYSTQAQLIQAEKMSSLGQVVAGIAHEINNPVSFIYGNLTPANEYVKSLIELINLYQTFYPQSPPEIVEKIADIELYFLIDDLPKLLNAMKTGAERISEIVLSLRTFSRLDEAAIKPVDIHSGIDSTLLILQHQLTSNDKYLAIEVIKEYNQLPQVNCYASALNQVFINIIGNAIDALHRKQDNSSKFNKPRITIRTSLKDDQNVLISIADNGVGISQSVLNKVFDPFFTTKPVGSGTGLGLSISYSIVVDKHGGKLSCISELGEGTEFVIELPLSPGSR